MSLKKSERMIFKTDDMKIKLRNIIFLLAICLAVVLNQSCGTTSNIPQTETVTQIYGSSFGNAPQVFSRYLPSDGIAEGTKIVFQTSNPERGLKVMNYHFESLFGAPQDISVIELDASRYEFKVADHVKLVRTSEIASAAGAAAAINGTFYDMKKGGSVCYLQIDGVVADTTKGRDMKVRATGAVVVRKGKLSVEPWNQDKEKAFRSKLRKNTSVMATMPLLIMDGFAVELPYYKGFSDKRHPRSVVFGKDGKVCLMVIDGRSKGNAAGMTLDEVQRYLVSIDGGKGCTSAVNLDGGGSSTLWTAKDGIINHPSDNSKFDHKGERRVANSIAAFKK